MRMMAKATPFVALLGAALLGPVPSHAITPLIVSGSLAGTVHDLIGIPQMGAVVFLYDHREKLCERTMTDALGTFVFKNLNPDSYSVRVTMASFLPALRNKIQIVPGVQKTLEVNLSTLFSSVQLINPQPGQTGLISDDWKWVLRTSAMRRPVLRFLPDPSSGGQSPIFSDTHALVKISGGDASAGSQADLGTVFGVATSVYGANQIQLVGNVGMVSATGMPTAGFRTTLSRKIGDSTPAISVTVRQLSIPSHWNAALTGIQGLDANTPFLRTMSVSMSNKTQLSDDLQIEYGMESDSISYLSHAHYNSPWAKLTYTFPFAVVDFTYTGGNARPDLGSSLTADGTTDDLEHNVAALAMIPRVTLLNNAAKIQSGQNFELGATRAFGSREVRVTAFRESVRNAALTVALPSAVAGTPFATDILPDLFSDTSVLNAGDYHTVGYTAAVTQNIGEDYHLTMSYGLVGALIPGESPTGASAAIGDDAELRALIHETHRNAVTAKASGAVRKTGTKFTGSYQITNYKSATSGHLYDTDPSHPEAGLNASIRQPIPYGSNRLVRMEATLELKNMLAQGYLPVTLTDGQRLLLMRTPRSLRGGLSFTF